MIPTARQRLTKKFLDAEFTRIEQTWFWQSFIAHIRKEAKVATELTLASANAEEKDLRTAAAIASAYATVLMYPEEIRAGRKLLPGQELVSEKSAQPHDPEKGDEETDHAVTE